MKKFVLLPSFFEGANPICLTSRSAPTQLVLRTAMSAEVLAGVLDPPLSA
jgi:hypothetical protein